MNRGCCESSAERLTHQADGLFQRGIFHERIFPDRVHELVFRDELIWSLGQVQQHRHRPRRKRNLNAVPEEELVVEIDAKRPEYERPTTPSDRRWIRDRV